MLKRIMNTIKKGIPTVFTISMLLSCAKIAPRIEANAVNVTNGLKVTMWGDANKDGTIDTSDVVTIMNYLAYPNKYGLDCQKGITLQGLVNGDVYQNGSGITNSDALSIEKFLLKQIDSLPESYLENSGNTTTTTTTGTTSSTHKPTTTTTEITTSARPRTTTSAAYTSTTTTTRPVTTTTTATTKPTTTSTTTTSTTTTTTTTTTTSTTTTTTTTTTTSTTTTTTTTTTSTTTRPITTTTTTTTTWMPPKKEDLVHEGMQIPEATYNILINTAKMYGIEKYSIEYSDIPVMYAYTDPGEFYCLKNGIAYGYSVQIIGGSEVKQVATEISKLKQKQYAKYEVCAFRPIVEADEKEINLKNYENTENAYKSTTGNIILEIENIEIPNVDISNYDYYKIQLEDLNKYNAFQFSNWYLIPEGEGGINKNTVDTSVPAGAQLKYEIDNNQFIGKSDVLTRQEFKRMVETAQRFDIKKFKIEWNNNTNPVYYSFVASNIGHNTDYGVQVIKGSDLPKVIDVMAECLKITNGDQEWANMEYKKMVEKEYWYWTYDKEGNTVAYTYSDFYNEKFYFISLDQNNNEDYRVYCS